MRLPFLIFSFSIYVPSTLHSAEQQIQKQQSSPQITLQSRQLSPTRPPAVGPYPPGLSLAESETPLAPGPLHPLHRTLGVERHLNIIAAVLHDGQSAQKSTKSMLLMLARNTALGGRQQEQRNEQ